MDNRRSTSVGLTRAGQKEGRTGDGGAGLDAIRRTGGVGAVSPRGGGDKRTKIKTLIAGQ